MRFSADEEVPQIRGDPRFLRSALTNLIRNAVKYTRRDSAVAVRVRQAHGHVRVEVQDQCGGLPEGAIEKMFDPFVQLGKDRSGYGLGLAIGRQAAQSHGGTLTVHNLPGSGCVFVLELPPDVPAALGAAAVTHH